MSSQCLYSWDEFRRLIDEIATADAATAGSPYHERWLAALETLLTARGVITRAELDVRSGEYLSGDRED